MHMKCDWGYVCILLRSAILIRKSDLAVDNRIEVWLYGQSFGKYTDRRNTELRLLFYNIRNKRYV